MIRPQHIVLGVAAAMLVAGCAPVTGDGSATTEAPVPSEPGTTVQVDAAASAAGLASQQAAAERATLARTLAQQQAEQIKADVEAAITAEAERIAEAEAAAEEARRKAEEEARKEAERVAAFQAVLKDLDYYDGGIDGDAGPKTTAAVEEFQAVHGLEVDGVVGEATQAALDSDDAKPKPPPPPPEDDDEDAPSTDLPDDRVLSVSDAKVALRDLKYFGGEINGDRTDSFRSALMAFQKVQGISVDGSLGPQSSAHLRDPRAPSLKGGNSNRIEIDLDRQVIHVVKDGTRIRTMPTSSGNGEEYETSSGGTANAKTPVGDFTIQRRISGVREADLGTLYDPLYFYKGWAIHGSNNVPAYPASHGCTRVTRTDILWLADQMPNGTQVRIYGGQHTFIPTG